MLALWYFISRSPRALRPLIVLLVAAFLIACAYHSAVQLRTAQQRSLHAHSSSK